MKNFAIVSALSLTLLAGSAFGHSDKHDKQRPYDISSAEQKAFGIAGDPRKAARPIKLAMGDDMRFLPNSIDVKQGETIKFIVINNGKLKHEMVIGTRNELQEHAALMKKFPEMEHDAPYMAHTAPGKSAEIVWTFNRLGEFDFACLMAGHFEAGMVGKIRGAP